MRKANPITTTSELEVMETGVLPSGLTIWKTYVHDVYRGAREALIGDGVALPHWFPSSPQLGRRGFTKRVYRLQGGIVLTDLGARDRWEVVIPVSDNERTRRYAELDDKFLPERFTGGRPHLRLVVDNDRAVRSVHDR